MTLEQVKEISAAIGERSHDELVNAANIALRYSGTDQRVADAQTAEALLRQMAQAFLDGDNYLFGGCLILPERLFNTGIQYSKDVIEEYVPSNQLLLMGANGTSKTWTMCILAYLDFWRDPLYTAVKMSAVNEEHLKGTMMANVKRLNEDANLPIACEKPTDMRLCAIGSHADMGISGVLFPQGKDPTSRLKGYRPKPIRKIPHAKFGSMSRTRFFGDEAQSYADGLFRDFGSLQSAMNGPSPVKLILGFNADSTGRKVVQLAMPNQGWRYEDVEVLYRWNSKAGWRVLRLDGSKSENVVARKIIHEGIQTYEGYMLFVRGGGDSSADYFEKARGWPPVKGAVNIVISPALITKCRGNLNFIGKVLNIAQLDCAYQGEDSPILTISRYGMCNYVIAEGGEKREFVDYLNPGQKKPRRCFQSDQQFKLEKSDPTELAEEVMRICRELSIPPENVVVDGSGNGFGTYSHLAKYWGNVLYIQWGRKSTELKVLHEDQEPASAVYEKIISEMWFSTRRWMESGCFWISTSINPFPLNEQLSTRRYKNIKGSFQSVESKPEYKSRGHTSPDEADSLIMGPQLIRERFYHLLPGMQVDAQFNEEVKDKWSRKEESDSHDSQDYIDDKLAESSAHID